MVFGSSPQQTAPTGADVEQPLAGCEPDLAADWGELGLPRLRQLARLRAGRPQP
jgi:hypothetical protein